jgi:hypothetical protein
MLVAPGARETRLLLDIDHRPLVFAVTAEAFKATFGSDSQVMACDEPGIRFTYIEIAVRIEIADVAVAADASLI